MAKKKVDPALNVLRNIEKNTRAKLPEILKLNLGAGGCELPGYKNMDRKTGEEVYPLELPDACADEIRASHVLEHFSHRVTMDVLKEWVRVLKPGGALKVCVPDMEVICHTVAAGIPINAEGYLMGGHMDSDDHHGAVFTRDKLSAMFCEAGLERVRIFTSDVQDCSSLEISLNMVGYKPSVPTGELAFDGVTFVLATPRYGPSEHHRCIYEALQKVKARVRSFSGCFWNQHLCNAIEDEIARPECRYICTLDYDSLFTTQDVVELYRIMETHPHIDALVPMQSGRGSNAPLFTMRDKYGKSMSTVPAGTFDGLTSEIATGHFGLTFIRADKLRDLPKPWMVGRPAADGGWGDGHVDPDIDFWFKWSESGRRVSLANHVVIGHIEDCILWPCADLSPIYQRVSDYIKHGKPPEAR